MRSAVSLKDQLAAPVSLYATHSRKRSPNKPRPARAAKILATHGSLTIVEVRDERGRRALRYVRDNQGAPWLAG